MELPSDILRDLLVVWCGADSDDLNADAFDQLETDVGTDYTLRRWIGAEVSSNTLIGEILLECAIDMSIRYGQYYPVLFSFDADADATLYDGDLDMVHGSFSARDDPEGVLCNRLKAKFGLDPSDGGYTDEAIQEDTDKQTAVDQVVSRTIYYNWLYDSTEITTLALNRHFLRVSNKPEIITVNLKHRAALLMLGEQIKFTYGRFSNNFFQIRETIKKFSKMQFNVSAWSLSSMFRVGGWTDDAAPNYANSTPEQKATNGFWQADAEPSPSDVSNWI